MTERPITSTQYAQLGDNYWYQMCPYCSKVIIKYFNPNDKHKNRDCKHFVFMEDNGGGMVFNYYTKVENKYLGLVYDFNN